MVKKVSKTYRLSEATLTVIEERDRQKYPTANEFVEHRILKEQEENDLKKVLDELCSLRKEIEEMKKHLLQNDPYRTVEKVGGFELPNL